MPLPDLVAESTLRAINGTIKSGSSPPDFLQAAFATVAPIIDLNTLNALQTAIQRGQPHPPYPIAPFGAWPQVFIDAAQSLINVDSHNNRELGGGMIYSHELLRPTGSPWEPGRNVTDRFWAVWVYAVHVTDTDDMMMMGSESSGEAELPWPEAEPDPNPYDADRRRAEHLAVMRARNEAAAAQPIGELARFAAGLA